MRLILNSLLLLLSVSFACFVSASERREAELGQPGEEATLRELNNTFERLRAAPQSTMMQDLLAAGGLFVAGNVITFTTRGDSLSEVLFALPFLLAASVIDETSEFASGVYCHSHCAKEAKITLTAALTVTTFYIMHRMFRSGRISRATIEGFDFAFPIQMALYASSVARSRLQYYSNLSLVRTLVTDHEHVLLRREKLSLEAVDRLLASGFSSRAMELYSKFMQNFRLENTRDPSGALRRTKLTKSLLVDLCTGSHSKCSICTEEFRIEEEPTSVGCFKRAWTRLRVFLGYKEVSDHQPVRVACSHVFHRGCAVKWSNYGKSCPECRNHSWLLNYFSVTELVERLEEMIDKIL